MLSFYARRHPLFFADIAIFTAVCQCESPIDVETKGPLDYLNKIKGFAQWSDEQKTRELLEYFDEDVAENYRGLVEVIVALTKLKPEDRISTTEAVRMLKPQFSEEHPEEVSTLLDEKLEYAEVSHFDSHDTSYDSGISLLESDDSSISENDSDDFSRETIVEKQIIFENDLDQGKINEVVTSRKEDVIDISETTTLENRFYTPKRIDFGYFSSFGMLSTICPALVLIANAHGISDQTLSKVLVGNDTETESEID